MGSPPLSEAPDRTGHAPDLGSEPWFSFTCPVCGHRDRASLEVGAECRVGCGHCETVLELSASSPSQEGAAVRVVVDDVERGTH